MLGKTTRGRKRLQRHSDITSKDYVTMKRGTGTRSNWQKIVINRREYRACILVASRRKIGMRVKCIFDYGGPWLWRTQRPQQLHLYT